MAQKGSAAKHMFYYLLALVTLGFAAIGLGQILFQMINASFPETTYYYESAYSSYVLRFGISSVIVAGPIYGLISYLINRDLSKGTLDKDSAVRKWLTYLILLASVFTVMGFLIGFLNSFLLGELTVKFILKVLSAIAISSLIFAYYLYDIRREKFASKTVIRIFGVATLIIAIATLVGGFMVIESPSKVRSLREDDERVNRLRNISYQVEAYYGENKKVPDDLSPLEKNILTYNFKDPVTEKPFEYRVLDAKKYELCAEFVNSNKDTQEEYPADYYSYPDPAWLHDVGRQCFEKKIPDYLDQPVTNIPPVK